jgi:5'(3')-deoxyribonucleotidase
MSAQLRICVDVDAVMRDFVGELRRCYDLDYPEMRSREVTAWDMLPAFPAFTTKEELKDYWSNRRASTIFRQGRLLDLAIPSILAKWRTEGHHVIIGTHQVNDLTRRMTLDWLSLNDIPYDSLVFTANKDIINCEVLIDDGVHNLRAMPRSVVPICYDQAWNQEWAGLRVYNWHHLTQTIEMVAR